MPTANRALEKAYDAGQAAQFHREPDDACPFPEGTKEHEAYMEGKAAPLAAKWQTRGRGAPPPEAA